MLLTSADAIREGLGFDDMVDVTMAIEQALHAAEAAIASALDTDFARGTGSDDFFVKEPGWQSGTHYETQFRLRRGLVVSGSVTTLYSELLSTVPTGLALTSANLDLERGMVKDVGTLFTGHYVRIGYQYGFEAQDAPNTDKYVFEQVPSWLQELAKIKTLIEMETSPVMENAGIKLDMEMLQRQYEVTRARHLRYLPLALLPL